MRLKWVPEIVFVVNGQINKDQESHKLECIVILKKGPIERIATTISSQLKYQNKSTSTIETNHVRQLGDGGICYAIIHNMTHTIHYMLNKF